MAALALKLPPAPAGVRQGRECLAKELDDLAIEGWNVAGFAARDELSVDHNFLVHPFGAGVLKISLQ